MVYFDNLLIIIFVQFYSITFINSFKLSYLVLNIFNGFLISFQKFQLPLSCGHLRPIDTRIPAQIIFQVLLGRKRGSRSKEKDHANSRMQTITHVLFPPGWLFYDQEGYVFLRAVSHWQLH